MSWIDKVNNIELEITTGDGKKYTPLWVEARRSYSFNSQSFSFVGIEGEYVERFKKAATSYPFVFIFQGENNLDTAEDFIESTKDSNPWTIVHPLYGAIIVQPTSLDFDNSVYNNTRVTGTLKETLLIKYPQEIISLEKKIIEQKNNIDILVATEFETRIADVIEAEIIANNNSISKVNNNYLTITDLQADLNRLKDLFRTVSGTLNDIGSDLNSYIIALENLINFPFLLKQGLQGKINSILQNIDDLSEIFISDSMSENEQNSYTLYGAVNFSQIAATITQSTENDVYSRAELNDIIDNLTSRYATYKENLDTFTIVQNFDLLFNLELNFLYSILNLNNRIFASKQEFSVLLNYPDNIINLVYKYYGNVSDASINDFIKYNAITLEERMEVPAGRTIKYLK